MAKFRQQASIRVSPPRYAPITNLASGDAVVFDSSPIVANAVNIAERQRQNEAYLNYLNEEKRAEREKQALDYLDKVSKDIKGVKLIDGLNVADTKIITDKINAFKEEATKRMMDSAGADSFTQYKVRDDINNLGQSLMDEMVMRKGAYSGRTKSIQEQEKELYPESKTRIYAENLNTPTYDSKMNPLDIGVYQNDLVGVDFKSLLKDIADRQDVNIGTEGNGSSGIYKKYSFNSVNAKKAIIQGTEQLLNTDKRDAVLRTIANDLYNTGSKDVIVQKDSTGKVISLKINPDKANQAIDQWYNMMVDRVERKQGTGYRAPTKDGSGSGSAAMQSMGGNVFNWQANVSDKDKPKIKNFSFTNYQNLPETRTEAISQDSYGLGLDGRDGRVKNIIQKQLGEGENLEDWNINLSNSKIVGEGKLPVGTERKSFKDRLGNLIGNKKSSKIILDENAVVGNKFKYNNEDFYHVLIDASKKDGSAIKNKQIQLFIPKNQVSLKPQKYKNNNQSNTPLTSGLNF